MLVWRIEHADTKRGPYCTAFHEDQFGDYSYRRLIDDRLRYGKAAGGIDAHPTPHDEGFSDVWNDDDSYGHKVCGCASREALREWFGYGGKEWPAEAERLGFVVHKLAIPDNRVWLGKRQCIFVRKLARVVRSFKPTEVLEHD